MSSPSPSDPSLDASRPDTPRKQSSIGMLSAAFLNLLGGNRPTPADTPSSATSVAPAHGFFSRRHSSSLPQADRPNIELPKQKGKEPAGHDDTVVEVPLVLGGPPELDGLLKKLESPKTPFAQRISTVYKVCAILKEYRVTGVWTIWTRAQDALLKSNDPKAHDAAYKLLYSLVQAPLSSFERSNFFSMVAGNDNAAIADNRMQLLSSITNGGRNIDALEAKIAPLLGSTLIKSFEAAVKARRENRNAKPDEQLPENVRLHRLFRLVILVLKFNSQHLADEHIDRLLEEILKICRQTTKKQDLHDGIAVMDTLITYKELPRTSLQPCLEILCAVSNQHMLAGALKDQAEDVIVHLAGSHVVSAATLTYYKILRGDLSSSQQRLNIIRGAINVLHNFMFGEKAENLPELQLSLVLPALSELLSGECERAREKERLNDTERRGSKELGTDCQYLETDISNIMWRLLISRDAHNRYARQLFEEYDWDVFMEIITKCVCGVAANDLKDGRRSAMTVDSIIFEDEEQQNYRPSVPLTGVIGKLYEIRDELDVVQKESTMMMFLHIGRKLPDHICKGVIKYLRDERFLLPVNRQYMRMWDRLLESFFRDKSRSNDVRNYAIQTLVDTYEYISDTLELKEQVGAATFILDHIYHESEPEVLKVLIDATVDIVSSGADDLFQHVLDLLQDYLWNFIGSLPEPERPPTRALENPMSPSNVITEGLVRMFTRTFQNSAWRATRIYNQLLYVARENKCDMDARLSAIKLLSRFRSDADYALRINKLAEGESMAIILYRTAETAAAAEKDSEAASETTSPVGTLERNMSQDRRAFVGGAQLAQIRRVTGGSSRPKPVPPLWLYPTPDMDPKIEPFSGLPEDPPPAASDVLFTHLNPEPMNQEAPKPETQRSDSEDLGSQQSENEVAEFQQSEDEDVKSQQSKNREVGTEQPEKDEAERPEIEESRIQQPEHEELEMVFGEYPVVPVGRVRFSPGMWLEVVIAIFQKCEEWEVLTYVLVHLGPQLANHTLWKDSKPQIKFLRNVICDQIRNGTVPEPPLYTSLKKADVAVCYFHILTVLVSYHSLFEKSEQDDIVKTFYLGIGSWDRTSKWCIHALTVCCHEIPESTTKHLQNVVQKMSQIITQPQIAIHILEFLTHLVRLPNLYVNFREDEYKMVFGVCFRYLQYVRDQQERAQAAAVARMSGGVRHNGPPREQRDSKLTPEQVGKPASKAPSDDLPQYVHALAYHVISFWFMAIKLDDRSKFVPWIKNRLIHMDKNGRETYEEQAQITIDMLYSRAYTDSDETAPIKDFPRPGDGKVETGTWCVGGEMLLTLQTAGRTGATQIIKRRPSYTSYGIYYPGLVPPPAHQVPLLTGLAAEAFYTTNYVGVLPQDIFQGLYAPINLLKVGATEDYVQLPEDDATRRAISAIDRSSTVDGHRIGVIFIGEGQSTEKEVLQNVMGSADYTQFVNALGEGKIIRLKGAKMNTQGLDREFGTDGTHAICWRDRAVEIVFHVITMMPTDLEHDPYCINKKKHIGNDYVNIVFNNSGIPFDFNMFPSQFNYVYIVITPESRTTFLDTRDNTQLDQFYKVQVLTQPGFPEVSPASETKVISGKGLPAYVRMLALNASVFCQVWSTREAGEWVSPWRNRLREIKKLWDKHGSTIATPPSTASGNPGTGGMSSSMWHRQSIATYNSDGNRSSIMSGSVDMERQISSGSR